MGRTLFVEAVAGIAGDMFVAALVHAGADATAVDAEVRKIAVEGWRSRVERVVRGPYAATLFTVEPSGADGSVSEDHGHDHDHHGHSHAHAAAPGPDAFPGQPYRNWRTIRALLESAPLAPRVRTRAVAVFSCLAEAEARVHGTAVEDVAFHEVGAVDSIVDIVAACAALESLDIERIVATPLPMGQGRVRSAHGILPVPVPAVVEVLRGFPVVPSPWSGELVTPTGAALVRALAEPGAMPAMRILSVGYGAGKRDPPDHANVLRVVLGEGEAGSPTVVCEVRAQVDDLPGEAVPGLIQALLDAGALDAWVTPVMMKKGRPGLLIGALATPDARGAVGDALLRHGGTFGYRWDTLEREVLGRRHVHVTTRWGSVRIKLGERGGVVVHAAPEFEDCAAIAREADVSVAEVARAALAAYGAGE